MKIEIRLENGKPILFFPDQVETRAGFISCYTENEQHSTAQRAYMRSLKKPCNDSEHLLCWQVLKRYAEHVLYTMKPKGDILKTRELIDALRAKKWNVIELDSGKVRFINPEGLPYLLTPSDAVTFGTWLNEKTLLNEPIAQ